MPLHWRDRVRQDYGNSITMRLSVPLNLANRRMHPMAVHRLKKAYWRACDLRQSIGLVPAPPAKPWRAAIVRATWHTHNRMDRDNATARLKWVLDWLVTRGYVEDDREENMAVELQPSQIDRGDPHLMLEIQPVEVSDG